MPTLSNPNCRIAPRTRSAFDWLERRKKSMSAEYRGKPRQETASAPTLKGSAELNALALLVSQGRFRINVGRPYSGQQTRE
jgi:hypothetical protein